MAQSLSKVFRWLKRQQNQKLVAILGSGFSAVVIAAWAGYTHFYPTKQLTSSNPPFHVEADCSVAAGNDLHGSAISVSCGLNREEMEDLIAATVDQVDVQGLFNEITMGSNHSPNLSDLSTRLNISENTLRSILGDLETIPPSDELSARQVADIILSNAKLSVELTGEEDRQASHNSPEECRVVQAAAADQVFEFAVPVRGVDRISGQWTVVEGVVRYVGPEGYVRDEDRKVAEQYAYKHHVTSYPSGALLVAYYKGGGWTDYIHIQGPQAFATPSQRVKLRINDGNSWIANNAGKLTVCFYR